MPLAWSSLRVEASRLRAPARDFAGRLSRWSSLRSGPPTAKPACGSPSWCGPTWTLASASCRPARGGPCSSWSRTSRASSRMPSQAGWTGVATDPWTQAQVDARAGRPVGEVLDEWEELAGPFEQAIGAGAETAPLRHGDARTRSAAGTRCTGLSRLDAHRGGRGTSRCRRGHARTPDLGAPPLRIVAGDEVGRRRRRPCGHSCARSFRGDAGVLRSSQSAPAGCLRLGNRSRAMAAIVHIRALHPAISRPRRVAATGVRLR